MQYHNSITVWLSDWTVICNQEVSAKLGRQETEKILSPNYNEQEAMESYAFPNMITIKLLKIYKF